MQLPKKSITYITNFIEKLLPQAKVYCPPNLTSLIYYFTVSFDNRSFQLSFDFTLLSDFENAITQSKDTTYYKTFENTIRFIIYQELAKNNSAPDLTISKELIEEKREWQDGWILNVETSQYLDRVLLNGLTKLSEFLKKTIDDHRELDLKEIGEDLQWIENLIKHYKTAKTFSESKTSSASRAYLKAAAICEIISLETKRKNTSLPRVQKRIDDEIYKIVAILRKREFIDTRVPGCINDYAEYIKKKPLTTQTKKIGVKTDNTDDLDVLLPIYSRKYLENICQDTIDECIQGDLPISVIMVDVDYFKKINDLYGHTTGDDALKVIAEKLKTITGSKGKVIRYGGEEICVLLPNFTSDEARCIAERIRIDIEQLEFKIKNRGDIHKITVSLGITTTYEKLDYRTFIDRADNALYFSKENGRNKTTIFDESMNRTIIPRHRP